MPDKPTNLIQDRQPAPGPDYEWECQCARCGSSVDRDLCLECDGSGYVPASGDADDDDFDPDAESVPCGECRGAGGWWVCLSSAEWCEAHPRPGREGVGRNSVEWFAVPEVSHAR